MSLQTTRYITVLLVLLLTGCTQASLLKFQGKFEADFEDFVDVNIQNNGRYRRSPGDRSPYPQNVDVTFTTLSDDVSLPLTRNDDVEQNVPIYISRAGGVTRQHVPVLQNVALYQNLEKGAAFMVEFNDTHIHNIFGSLHLHDEEYFLEQTNQTRPFKEPTNQTSQLNQQQSKLYKLFKTKQRDLKYDFILEDGRTGLQNMRRKFDHNLGGHVRNKRAITANQVELLIATDYSVYQYWYDESTATTTPEKDVEAKASVRQFYAFVMNAIDVRYKSIVSPSISMGVVFAGIYIADSFAASTWTEDRIAVGSKFAVNINTALTKFRTWEQATSGLPSHDHAMMFTKYDFTNEGDGGVAGLAYLNGICGSTKQSVAEDLFDFGMMTIAAHELGHNLGASHDGEGNTCSFNDGYIMAATSLIQTGATATHPWQFSSCSVTSFENRINSLNSIGSNCLTSLSSNFDPTALTPYDQIAGQMFDADAQCRHIVGDNSYLCRGFYYQDYTSICNRMYCSKADGSDFCSEHVPADGTSCGQNKWCVRGECVSNASAPSVSDTCPFGDQAGVVSSGHTCASVVQLNAYNCNTTGWYSYCCSTCGALYTGIPGCEYGDRSSQCNATNCPFYSASSLQTCCGTCAVTTTTSTPTTTTTTPITTTTTPTTTTTTPTTITTTPTTTTTTPTTTTTTPTTTTTTPTTTTTTPTTTTTTPTTTTTTPTTTTTTPTTTTTTPTTTTTTLTTTTTTPTTTTTTPTTTTTTPTTTTLTTTTTTPITTITTSTTTTPTTTTSTPIPTTTTPPTTATQTTPTTPTTPTTTTNPSTSTTLTITAIPTTPTKTTTNRSTSSSPTSTTTPTSNPTTSVSLTTSTNTTTPGSTTTADELMEMLIIGVSVGVAGLLFIILIAVAVCLICRTVNRTKSPRGGSASPSVDSTYITDMYNGKTQRTPAPTPAMSNNPYLPKVTPSPSTQSRDGRAQTPAAHHSHVSSPQTQKWYPVYGYTNHGLQVDSAMDNYTDPTMTRQPYTDFHIRGHYH